MLAHRQAMKIVGENAVELLDERYDGYRVDIVRRLSAIIGSQASAESEAKRQQEVLAELDALAELLVKNRKKS